MSSEREPFARLTDYETGALSEADAAEFEAELFAAAATGAADEAAFVERVTLMGQFLLPRGGFDVGSTRARIDQLIASGLRVQVVEPTPAAVVQFPSVDDDAELFVTVIPLDLRGFDSLDVVVEKPDGTEIKTFRDVTCDPESGYLYGVCEAPLARISLQQPEVVTRIIGTRHGERVTLAVFAAASPP